jgi:hypothetical protein
MIAKENEHPTVVRTERGLSVSGTRITLYEVMDYMGSGWPLPLIRDRLQLTERQMAGVTQYIEQHRAEVEEEYRNVLRIAEENRHFWEEYQRERRRSSTRRVQSRSCARATEVR